MVMQEKLNRLLEILRENLADLRRYAAVIPPGGLAADRDRQHMVLHALYVTIQAMLDAANHVVAARGLARANTYTEILTRLSEAGVLKKGLAERLSDWASLRNVLAHFYPVVDFERVEHALRNELDDFDEFLGAMERAGQ
jgi:uncharacterized protein YutE (UPF0331/DUF86 family)